jgi:hypothetical protein
MGMDYDTSPVTSPFQAEPRHPEVTAEQPQASNSRRVTELTKNANRPSTAPATVFR